MILGHDGTPLANPDIQRRLAQIDPRLTLQFMKWGEKEWWAVMERWPENDPRWQRVQGGEIPEAEAQDMLCMLPGDCSPDQAYGYLVNTLVANQGRASWQKLLQRVGEYNRQQQEQAKQQVLEVAEDLTQYAASKGLLAEQGKGVSKVFLNFGKKK